MNRHVNAIAGRLSLRAPQRQSLEILDRVTEIVPPRKETDLQAALAAIKSEFPAVTDFEREFPSLCFALATGVGKTRLMGAFISYLHLAHGINNFFVLAPNLTIYNKLISDFTPNTPKYVFTGVAEFATDAPAIVTGDNYEQTATEALFERVTVVSRSQLDRIIGGEAAPAVAGSPAPPPIFETEVERRIAEATVKAIERYELLPSSTHLLAEDVQREIVKYVAEVVAPAQMQLGGVTQAPDVPAIVRKATSLAVERFIDIPRIVVVPKGEVTVGYEPFKLDVSGIRYQPVERDLLIQHLRTHEQETLSFGPAGQHELRLEDYVVRGLIDFDDISYDDHADFLYNLAGQVVAHLGNYLSEDDTRSVLIYHQKQIAAFVHAQMEAHQRESPVDYDVEVRKGFTRLKGAAFTAKAGAAVQDFRQTVEDKSRIPQILFGGFRRCLFEPVKFQSDTERRLAVILEREAEKWFRPAKGQFQIYYKSGVEHPEYVPDFVAEAAACIYMLESKARNEMNDADVLAKKAAAETWCGLASAHTARNGGKPWRFLLIPHDTIAENQTLAGLANT